MYISDPILVYHRRRMQTPFSTPNLPLILLKKLKLENVLTMISYHWQSIAQKPISYMVSEILLEIYI